MRFFWLKFLKIGLFAAAGCAWAGTAGADLTATAQNFTAQGKNRATIQTDRQPLTDRPDIGFRIGELVTRNEGVKLPSEPRYLYQDMDPVPLASYKLFTPWTSHFRQSMVFVLGKFNSDRLKIARWSLTLRDALGQEIRTFGGVGNPPEAFSWNGRDAQYNPVLVGQAYIPELTLEDYYGARVHLPQKMFYVDQFLWEDSLRLTLAFMQNTVFEAKRSRVSSPGQGIIREVSNLVNQQDGWVMEIECSGTDQDLSGERAQALKAYFSRENLRLKNIRIKNAPTAGEAMVKITSLKPGAAQAAEDREKR